MAYGTIKVDQVTFTNGGVDQTISVSGIVQSISGDITATGTIQGATLIGTSIVSGATVTGNIGNFTSGVFVNVSGTTISGDTGQYTTLTGGTATFTSGVFALGTSGTPSLSFSGDVDTGIYSPGGNQLAISTNGTGALFIDENGNVGIGAAAASGRRLHVQGAGFQEVLVEKTDATTGAILLAADSGLAGIYTRSTVADSTAIPLALHTGNTERLRITSDGTVNIKGAGTAGVTQAVSFSGSAPVNSLVVQATTGNVGLGTSSPGTLLHASTSVETVATLQNTTNAAATRTLLRFSQHDNSDSVAGTIGINRAGANAGVGFEINLANSAGAQQNRLTILEAGNVGVGTTNPANLLHLSGNNTLILSDWTSANNLIRFEDTDTTTATSQVIGGIVFQGNDSDIGGTKVQAVITANSNSSTGGGQFRFYTAANGTALSGSEDPRLIITGTGNVGIGIVAPLTPLHVLSTSQFDPSSGRDTAGFYVQQSGGTEGDGAYGTAISLGQINGGRPGGAIATVQTTADKDQTGLAFFTHGSSSSTDGLNERVRIDAGGNFGIGTVDPATLLHLSSATGTNPPTPTELRIETTSNGGTWSTTDPWGRISFYSSDLSAGGPKVHAAIDAVANSVGGNSSIFFRTSSDSDDTLSERMTITPTGVGIGTTSPGAQLEISNTGNVRIYADAAGGYIEQTVSNLDSLHLISSGFVKYQSDPQNDTTSTGHIFECDGSEKARIDSSGRLLVGTSITPPAVETIVPQIVSSSATQADRAQDVAIYNFQNASGSGRLRVGPKLFLGNSRSDTNGAVGGLLGSADLVGTIRFAGDDGAKFLTVAEITCEMDGVPGTDDMPGKLIFSTTADGASSPTERMTIKQTGAISCYQTGSDALVLRSSQAAGTTNKLITALYSGTGVDSGGTTSFIVYTNGNVVNTNNSYGQITSDERFKQDIIDAPSQWDDIKAVRLTKYRWKSDPTGDLLLGPIAQELQSVSPGLVDTRIATAEDVPASGGLVAEGDEVLGFKASILYMKAVGALQEAMERIEILEAKVAALEAS